MFLKLYLICICISIIQTKNLQDILESNWSQSLLKYISNDSKKHQVLFLVEDGTKNQIPEVETILQKVSAKFPSFTLLFEDAINTNTRYKIMERNLRGTTICILILVSKNESLSSRLSRPIKFLTHLSKEKALPKCLIINFQKKSSCYKDFLQNLWNKQFFDLTIIEVIKNYTSKEILKPVLSVRKEVAILHQFNSFSQVYTREIFSSKLQWFPNKLHNLHGFKVNSIILTLDIMDSYALSRALSKAMNFTFNLTVVDFIQVGTYSCNKKLWTGKLAELLDNKFQFALILYMMVQPCISSPHLQSRTIFLETINAVVPRLRIGRLTIDVSSNFLYTLAGMGISIVAVQFIPSKCKFEKAFWRPLHILQIIIGMSVTEEPKNVKDKIIFGSMLITCLIYSSYLFTVFTDIGLYDGSEMEILDMKELLNSGLIPFFNPEIYEATKNSEIIDFVELRKTGKLYSQNYTIPVCLKDAVRYKNVSCTMKLSSVKYWFKILKESQKMLKTVEEPIQYGAYQWIFPPGSPYAESFNEFLLKNWENGLLRYWRLYEYEDKNKFRGEISWQPIEESWKLQFRLFIVLICGYLLSSIVFIIELLIFRKRRKI